MHSSAITMHRKMYIFSEVTGEKWEKSTDWKSILNVIDGHGHGTCLLFGDAAVA
jgi:hypothetical protein